MMAFHVVHSALLQPNATKVQLFPLKTSTWLCNQMANFAPSFVSLVIVKLEVAVITHEEPLLKLEVLDVVLQIVIQRLCFVDVALRATANGAKTVCNAIKPILLSLSGSWLLH